MTDIFREECREKCDPFEDHKAFNMKGDKFLMGWFASLSRLLARRARWQETEAATLSSRSLDGIQWKSTPESVSKVVAGNRFSICEFN